LKKKDSVKELSTAKKPEIEDSPDQVKQEENSDYENAFEDEPNRTESKANKENSRYDQEDEEEERVVLKQQTDLNKIEKEDEEVEGEIDGLVDGEIDGEQERML
jgi:hypothetical protein